MSETQNMGLTAEELDDLAWVLVEMFPEVARDVSPVHNQEFWQAKATQLLPVINKIRDRARKEAPVVGGFVDAEPVVTPYEEGPGAKPTPEEIEYMRSLKDEDIPEGKIISLDEALEKTSEGD